MEERLQAILRAEIASMKSYIDATKATSGSSGNSGGQVPTQTNIDMDVINDYVTTKVSSAFSASLTALTSDLYSEQSSFIEKVEEQLSKEKLKHDLVRESVSAMEKELTKLRLEATRTRGRCDVLEDATRELSNSLVSKEQSIEESVKRVVSSCRSDVQRVADSIARKVNEAMARSRDDVASAVTKMEGDHRTLKSKVKALSNWRAKADEQSALSEQVVVRLFEQMQPLQQSAGLVTEMCFKIDALEAASDRLAQIEVVALNADSVCGKLEREVFSLQERGDIVEEALLEHKHAIEGIEQWGQQAREKLRQVSEVIRSVEAVLARMDGSPEGGSEKLSDREVEAEEAQQGEMLLAQLMQKKKDYRSAYLEKLQAESEGQQS
jgi:chromosome segregation ATPase